jgi:hypothetical protein
LVRLVQKANNKCLLFCTFLSKKTDCTNFL